METLAPRIVLVPGFWLGAWAWDEVATRLRQSGHDVLALTLPGLEDGSDAAADPGAVTLEDHVAAITDAIGDGPVVLVAHSGAAIPATVAIDRDPARVAHAIWVDTAPVVDGAAMNPDFEGDAFPLAAAWDEELEGGSMRGLTDAQLATFRERAVPQPGATVRDAVSLADDARLDVPGTIICTAFSADDYRSYAQQGVPFLQGLLEHRALDLVDLPTGHWPMWSTPVELAERIGAIASGAAAGS